MEYFVVIWAIVLVNILSYRLLSWVVIMPYLEENRVYYKRSFGSLGDYDDLKAYGKQIDGDHSPKHWYYLAVSNMVISHILVAVFVIGIMIQR